MLLSRIRTPRTSLLNWLNSKLLQLKQKWLACKLSWHRRGLWRLLFPVHKEYTRRPPSLFLHVGLSEGLQRLQARSSTDSDHRLLFLEDHLLLQQRQQLRLLQLMFLLVHNQCLGQTEVTEEVDQLSLSHHFLHKVPTKRWD